MSHTPGPWIHCTDGYPRPDVRAASGRAVAITWMVCSSTPKTTASYQARCEEDRANARLIAAAPDLLEACEEALIAIRKLPISLTRDAPEWQEPMIAAHLRLLEAVEKARGES